MASYPVSHPDLAEEFVRHAVSWLVLRSEEVCLPSSELA